MTFEERLKLLAELANQVIPVVVNDPATQSKIGGYVGLGLFAAGLLQAILAHNTQPTKS